MPHPALKSQTANPPGSALPRCRSRWRPPRTCPSPRLWKWSWPRRVGHPLTSRHCIHRPPSTVEQWAVNSLEGSDTRRVIKWQATFTFKCTFIDQPLSRVECYFFSCSGSFCHSYAFCLVGFSRKCVDLLHPSGHSDTRTHYYYYRQQDLT